VRARGFITLVTVAPCAVRELHRLSEQYSTEKIFCICVAAEVQAPAASVQLIQQILSMLWPSTEPPLKCYLPG
jgi:hypothetical protein